MMKRLYPLITILIVLSGSVSAHTALRSSTPADGDSLEQPPKEIELMFSEPVSLVKAEFFVTSESVEREVDIDFEPTRIRNEIQAVPLPESTPKGNYRFVWTVLGTDGHPVSGEVVFTTTNLPSRSEHAEHGNH